MKTDKFLNKKIMCIRAVKKVKENLKKRGNNMELSIYDNGVEDGYIKALDFVLEFFEHEND